MRLILLFTFTFLIAVTAQAQFPNLEISADSVTTAAGVTVDVPIRAGTNWSNITTLNGTITFDTTIVTWNQMSFLGLPNPAGATFTYQGAGVLTYTWTSQISVGPTLSANAIVFTLRFDAVGAGGQATPITFTNSPQPLFWNNGFGWSGNNFNATTGEVKMLGCSNPASNFGKNANGLNAIFTDSSLYSPTSWLWDFGDGNTSTLQNPTHTYTVAGNYSVCLTSTNACGSNPPVCQSFTVINCTPTQETDTRNECSPFVWIDGNSYTSNNNTATFTIPGGAVNTCDSIVTLDFTVIPEVHGTDTRDACDSFTWIDGNTYTSNNNTATFTIAGGAANTCDSIVTLNLTFVVNIDATVTKTNNSLQSNQSGATYQWIDCNGNVPVPAHTNQSFNATVNGSYAVIINNNGCIDTSACYDITTVGVNENTLNSSFSVYPNPAKNQLTISFTETIDASSFIKIQNAVGQSVQQFQPKNKLTNLDLSEFNAGIYFVTIKNAQGSKTVKVIKE